MVSEIFIKLIQSSFFLLILSIFFKGLSLIDSEFSIIAAAVFKAVILLFIFVSSILSVYFYFMFVY